MHAITITKPAGTPRHTVVLEVQNTFEWVYGCIEMSREYTTEAHPLAHAAADRVLARMPAAKRAEIEQRLHDVAEGMRFIEQEPLQHGAGAFWLLGARREMRLGERFFLRGIVQELPRRMTRGDSFDMTIETPAELTLTFSLGGRGVPEGAVEWRDSGDAVHSRRRCADPTPPEPRSPGESLVLGRLLAEPGHTNPDYAIRVLRDSTSIFLSNLRTGRRRTTST